MKVWRNWYKWSGQPTVYYVTDWLVVRRSEVDDYYVVLPNPQK
jgi:hypothetical protein